MDGVIFCVSERGRVSETCCTISSTDFFIFQGTELASASTNNSAHRSSFLPLSPASNSDHVTVESTNQMIAMSNYSDISAGTVSLLDDVFTSG